jgi:uncharacterized protein YgiM (DUF1202 family)
MRRTGRVVADYRCAFPDPLILRTGDELVTSDKVTEWPGWVWCTAKTGKSGWVPESYIARTGRAAVATRDYDATELTVTAGDELEVLMEESQWLWCVNSRGENGWVPMECVHIGRDTS